MTFSLNDPAREWLNKVINKDAQFKDIASKIDFNRGEIATVSGIRVNEYAQPHVNVGGQLEFEKTTAIPPELLERLNSVRQCCRMGIFPQCRKAWITVDSEFYLWNFEDGEDVAFYDGCDDVIVSVCLFRPKADILPSAIEYLLALVTPSNLVVLGVTYDCSTTGSGFYSDALLNVLPTPLYFISTDNNYITCMEGTSNGRLFMGNREGDLLEFVYKPIPSLDETLSCQTARTKDCCSIVNHTASSFNFLLPTIITSGFRNSGAIVQIAVDSRRGLLWTLSNNSHLAVYQFLQPGAKSSPNNYLSKVASISASDLAYRASSVARTVMQSVDRNQFSQVVSICALTNDTGPLQMMAVTVTGIRIYFAEGLRLAHVRMPLLTVSPQDGGTTPQPAFGEVRFVAETRGTVIFASSSSSQQQAQQQPETLTLYVASPDGFPWSPCLCESVSTSLNVESPWALTVLPAESPVEDELVSAASFNRKGIELPHDSSPQSPHPTASGPVVPPASPGGPRASSGTPSTATTTPSIPVAKGTPPVMLTQHLDAPYRRVLVMTAHGIVHLRLPTPLQRLRDHLAASAAASGHLLPGEGEGEAAGFLSAFLHQYGPDESVCAALAIAASEQMRSEVLAAAERAVLFFITEATRFWQPPVFASGSPPPPPPPQQAPFMAFQQGHYLPYPHLQQQQQHQQDWVVSETYLLLGASLYLSRVARPLWRAPILVVADRALAGVRPSARGGGERDGGGLTSFVFSLITTAIVKVTALGSDDAAGEDSRIIISRLTPEDLEWVLHQLRYLKTLLESVSRRSFFSVTGGLPPTPHGSTSAVSPLNRILRDFCGLLAAFIEFVGLWQVIAQHNVPAITSRLSAEQRQDLLTLPVEAFVCWMPRTATSVLPQTSTTTTTTVGCIADIRTALISALIESYIASSSTTASIDSLCVRLRAICPSLFGNEDALCARADELLTRAAAAPSDAERAALIGEALERLNTAAGPAINLPAVTNKLIASVGGWGPAVALCLTTARRRDPQDLALLAVRGGGEVKRENSEKAQSREAVVESRYEAYRVAMGVLGGLLEASNLPAAVTRIPEVPVEEGEEEQARRGRLALAPVEVRCVGASAPVEVLRCTLVDVLKMVFKSDDVLVHYEVIGWLLSNNLLEQVVASGSPYLEDYLQSRLRQSPNDVALLRLLWRQLEARGARLDAARVLEHLATMATPGLSLDDRLDYLARAIVTVKALPHAQCAEPAAADYLADLQERLEVGELQRQLCLELAGAASASTSTSTSLNSTDVEQALQELTRGPLLPAAHLFSAYANAYDLHEGKLLLLHYAGEADADLVEAIWRALLHRLFANLSTSSPSTQRRRVSGNRKTARGLELTIANTLGRLYARLAAPTNAAFGSVGGVDYTFFPLVVVVSTLERYAIQQSLPANWVPSVFADAKIPPSPEVAEAYNVVLCKKDAFWMRETVRTRLVEVIYIFVMEFLESANRLSQRQRQLQASRMLDHLTTHLVELHAEPKSSGGGDMGGSAKASAGAGGGAHSQHLVLVEKLRGLRRYLDRMAATGAN